MMLNKIKKQITKFLNYDFTDKYNKITPLGTLYLLTMFSISFIPSVVIGLVFGLNIGLLAFVIELTFTVAYGLLC